MRRDWQDRADVVAGMTWLKGRISDWLREARIRTLAKRCLDAQVAGSKTLTRAYWEELVTEIMARSPEQVARLEQAKGLRA